MKQKGFTLIELLVTMGIIAVLSGMAIFNFNQARIRARDVQRKSDLSQLQKALELYKVDNNGKYPISAGFQETALIGGKYTTVTFNDPKGADWYVYDYVTDQKTYTLSACLENRADTSRVFGQNCGNSQAGVLYQVKNP
jgi:prepilin-type N-terminal cleavage/methylation domain-containing protein